MDALEWCASCWHTWEVATHKHVGMATCKDLCTCAGLVPSYGTTRRYNDMGIMGTWMGSLKQMSTLQQG